MKMRTSGRRKTRATSQPPSEPTDKAANRATCFNIQWRCGWTRKRANRTPNRHFQFQPAARPSHNLFESLVADRSRP